MIAGLSSLWSFMDSRRGEKAAASPMKQSMLNTSKRGSFGKQRRGSLDDGQPHMLEDPPTAY
jgi:hypothetical protein